MAAGGRARRGARRRECGPICDTEPKDSTRDPIRTLTEADNPEDEAHRRQAELEARAHTKEVGRRQPGAIHQPQEDGRRTQQARR
jgi:hypothetical protein